MTAKEGLDILKETAKEWSADKAPRLAAALAYYTLFSLAPLLVIAIAVAGLAFGQEAARGEVMRALDGVLGSTAAKGIETMIQNSAEQKDGIIATVLGLLTLLFGASGVFGQLHDTLNTIWGVEPKKKGFGATVRQRFLSFTMVLGVGFLLLVSLVISAGLSAAGKYLSERIPLGESVWHVLNMGISIAVITVLFAAIYKFVPDADIAWNHVWTGALFTSVLFGIGKFGIGMYLGKSAMASTYGAGASLVLILVWLYYSSMILFFGAEFTEVWARRRKGATGRHKAEERAAEPAVEHHPAAPIPAPAPAFARNAQHPSAPRAAGGKSRFILPLAAGAGGLVAGLLVGVVGTVVKVVKAAAKVIPH